MPGDQDIPGAHVFRAVLPIASVANTPDEYIGFAAPFNMAITAVKWIPAAAVTANGSNFQTLSVRNRGAAGAGTALPASRSYAATNSVAQVPEAMTLSGTATDLLVTAGDVITVQRLVTGTGVIVPSGVLEISATYR